MGEARRRQPDEAKRIAEGIQKREAKIALRKKQEEDRLAGMTPEEKAQVRKIRRMLAFALGLTASS